MSRPRRARVVALPARPPMPLRLAVFNPTDWGAPGEAPADGDWRAWEAAHRRAAADFDASSRAWLAELAHLPVSDDPVLDEPFCGESGHDCGGPDCSMLE